MAEQDAAHAPRAIRYTWSVEAVHPRSLDGTSIARHASCPLHHAAIRHPAPSQLPSRQSPVPMSPTSDTQRDDAAGAATADSRPVVTRPSWCISTTQWLWVLIHTRGRYGSYVEVRHWPNHPRLSSSSFTPPTPPSPPSPPPPRQAKASLPTHAPTLSSPRPPSPSALSSASCFRYPAPPPPSCSRP
jgi:hypothetical protein